MRLPPNFPLVIRGQPGSSLTLVLHRDKRDVRLMSPHDLSRRRTHRTAFIRRKCPLVSSSVPLDMDADLWLAIGPGPIRTHKAGPLCRGTIPPYGSLPDSGFAHVHGWAPVYGRARARIVVWRGATRICPPDIFQIRRCVRAIGRHNCLLRSRFSRSPGQVRRR